MESFADLALLLPGKRCIAEFVGADLEPADAGQT